MHPKIIPFEPSILGRVVLLAEVMTGYRKRRFNLVSSSLSKI